MRVCLFTDTLADVNGVARFIQTMSRQAKACGRGLTVVTSTRSVIPEDIGTVNLPVLAAHRIPRYDGLQVALPAMGSVRRALAEHRPDVVHLSTPGPVGVAARRAALRLGIPVVATYHTDFPAYIGHLFGGSVLPRVARAVMRWFYRPLSAVLTRSRGYRDAVRGLGLADERIIALEPGIDTGVFDCVHRDEAVWERHCAGVPGSALKVLYVGRVSVEKNLPLLVCAWREARRECAGGGIDARLVIVGDGPYRSAMERQLAGCGAHFLGFRHGQTLAALYAAADFFVFPSATDTLGQAVMEAQASGLSVLVSDRGGPREIVQEGATGLVLPSDDARAWAGAIAAMARDAEMRRRMGEAAWRSMRTRSIRASFEHFWSVHESVAAGSNGATAGRPAGRGRSGP